MSLKSTLRRILSSRGFNHPMVPAGLFAVTVLTTLLAGALQAGVNPFEDPWTIWKGIPLSFTLLLILGCHELGHWLASRRHGVEVSFPYFIPGPALVGTFGAFYRYMRGGKPCVPYGVAEFWDTAEALRADSAVLIASRGGADAHRALARVRSVLEGALGYGRVLHVADFIDRGTFLGHDIADTELVVGFLHEEDRPAIPLAAPEVEAAGLKVLQVDLRGKGVAESREALWQAVVASVLR